MSKTELSKFHIRSGLQLLKGRRRGKPSEEKKETRFEKAIRQKRKERGVEKSAINYYNLWLHTGEEVETQHSSDNKKEMVTIKGLDEDGYLQVQSKDDVKVFSVHDDGNTFDMMKRLIRPKMQ